MAEELVGQIPDKFKKGLAGIYVSPNEVRDDDIPGVYVLGHYNHGGYYEPSIDIYYGSFRKVFRGLPSLQLQNELWETITHEIRHHLEESAGLLDLRIFDQRQKEYFRLQQDTGSSRVKLLPTHPVLNLKSINNQLMGDLILESNKAPQKIKVNLSGSKGRRQILLIDFPKGIIPNQVIKLNLVEQFRQAKVNSVYFQIHPFRKYPNIRTLSGRLWYLFDLPNLKKGDLFVKEKGANDNHSWSAKLANFKRIDDGAYFDVFLNSRSLKKDPKVYIANFTVDQKGIIIRFSPEDLHNPEGTFTKHIPNKSVHNCFNSQEVYLTFHLF
ncbi:MAG: hypothetical protein ACE5IW_05160 [bacterium]